MAVDTSGELRHQKGPVLIVAAHPDDETIGAAARMMRWDPSIVTILHVTDGSPNSKGESHDDYWHERRRELYRALDLVRIRPDQCLQFKYVDQQVYQSLPELVDRLKALVYELRPAAIYAHPYEGGHPDHDSIAFAAARAAHPGTLFEFASYHMGPQGMRTGEFLNGGETEILELTHEEQNVKREMLQCFRSQQEVLSYFSTEREKFRPAPAYDFSQPPHPGTLHYETLGWNITGEDWRRRAIEAGKLL